MVVCTDEILVDRLLMEVFKSWCKKTAETYKRADAGVHADDDK
jgi:hypothetical protein